MVAPDADILCHSPDENKAYIGLDNRQNEKVMEFSFRSLFLGPRMQNEFQVTVYRVQRSTLHVSAMDFLRYQRVCLMLLV